MGADYNRRMATPVDPIQTRRPGILVTGGAGYIGSHTVLQLRARGERVVVLDDLSTGFRQAVLDAPLVVGDVADSALVAQVLREHEVDTVLHFAAALSVPESVRDPLKYYGNNTAGTRALLAACTAHGVSQFVFSSTAAVYGTPDAHERDEAPRRRLPGEKHVEFGSHAPESFAPHGGDSKRTFCSRTPVAPPGWCLPTFRAGGCVGGDPPPIPFPVLSCETLPAAGRRPTWP